MPPPPGVYSPEIPQTIRRALVTVTIMNKMYMSYKWRIYISSYPKNSLGSSIGFPESAFHYTGQVAIPPGL